MVRLRSGGGKGDSAAVLRILVFLVTLGVRVLRALFRTREELLIENLALRLDKDAPHERTVTPQHHPRRRSCRCHAWADCSIATSGARQLETILVDLAPFQMGNDEGQQPNLCNATTLDRILKQYLARHLRPVPVIEQQVLHARSDTARVRGKPSQLPTGTIPRLCGSCAHTPQPLRLYAFSDRLASGMRDQAPSTVERKCTWKANRTHAPRSVDVANPLISREPGADQDRTSVRS